MSDDTETSTPEPVSAQKWAAKHDATTKAAMDIIERERAAEVAKTARLRAARLARDEASDGSAT
jgi:hypothetical protein